jgi:hypothetical protein
MNAFHNFADSLAASHKASDLPLWETVYRQAFPQFLTMVDHRDDGEHQRAGIDRSVILANSKQLLIDEKIRWPQAGTGRVFTDILLEHTSNDRTKAPGWVCKPLRADYIAYAIAGLGLCYMLPVIQLQVAWAKHGDQWRQEYFEAAAQNSSYRTLSTAVPVDVLFRAIGGALRVKFEKVQSLEAA